MEQDHTIPWAVDNDSENVQNVAAEYAYIQRFLLQARCVRAAKGNPLTIVAFKTNLCRNIYRICEAANSTDSILRLDTLKI